MRTAIAIVVLALSFALDVCAWIAHRSKKEIAPSVVVLLTALIPPVLGNLLIILAHTKGLATLGCYVYFLGMDFAMFGLLGFTLKYCQIDWRSVWQKRLVYAARLIREGHSAVKAAELTGYNDYSAFHRAFKASFGISPGKIMK